MNCKDIALMLCAEDGLSGGEGGAAAKAAELLSPFGKTYIDKMGSVLCELFPATAGAHHFLLDAHIDEIGLIVTDVTEEGFLRVANVGGVDRRLLCSAGVMVHGERVLPGIVCSALLYQEGDAKNPKLDEVLVDIGLTTDAAKKAVRPGDAITFCGPARELAGGLISGKALDNRAGCAVLIRVAELLKDKKLRCGVTIALSVQEETTGVGSKTAGWPLEPTHAIAVDVTFGRTPDAEKHRTFPLGGGPTIVTAPILSGKLSRKLAEVAEAGGIPFHRETENGPTGTNADGLAVLGAGVATGIIGIPQRYMHTPVEVVDPRDMEHAARLIADYLSGEEGVQ